MSHPNRPRQAEPEMNLARQRWNILKRLERDFANRIREFMVIGWAGEGVIMITEPNEEGFWYGDMQFEEELKVATEPTPLHISKLRSMAQGDEHILLLDQLGQCFAMGRNNKGQLGLSTVFHNKIHFSPQKIPSPHKFIEVRCGMDHSLALTEDGKVCGWGENTSYQAGLPRTTSPILTPQQISHLSPYQVLAIECGGFHSLALTDKGEVYGWGDNRSGQLGHPDLVNLPIPTKLSSLSFVIQVAAGYGHTLVLTEEGLVFACGLNSCGQLALPTYTKSSPSLCQVSGLPRITQISSHFDTDLSIALSIDLQCFVWGWWKERKTCTPLQLSSIYSTIESPITVGSYPRNTPHSVRLKVPQCMVRQKNEALATPNPLLNRISRMFDNPDSEPDLQFVWEDKSILAHRSVLQISSGHFSSLFSEFCSCRCADLASAAPSTSSSQSNRTISTPSTISSVPTTNITRIPILNHSYPIFYAFIRYFYTGQLQVSSDFLPVLFETAHLYECFDLQQLCHFRMQSSVSLETCCQYYQLTDRYQLPQLQSQLLRFIADNSQQVFQTIAYRSLDAQLARKLTLAIVDIKP